MRLLPRFLGTLNPLNLVYKLPSPDPKRRVSRATRERAEQLLAILDAAEAAGCAEALAFRAEVRMFPPKGIRQDLASAYDGYRRFLDVSSDPHSQFIVGFFHASGLGGAVRDQAKATLYYTFAALQGYQPAQMAMGFRYWAGIGVKEVSQSAGARMVYCILFV
jgi:SEL1 protein